MRRVIVDGDLDWEDSLELEKSFRRAARPGVRTLVFDAANIGFVDSGGLRALIVGRRMAETAGVAFVIERPTAALDRLLELTGLDGVFRIARRRLQAAVDAD